jgi:hypothetical protein
MVRREVAVTKKMQLFVDLDGVLADFDGAVRRICGAAPDAIDPGRMWKAVAHTSGFYEHLDWMPDGQELWAAVKSLEPIILTGLPRGNWAEPQKRRWCARELGQEVPVIACQSREKHLEARQVIDHDVVPVLIDDRQKLQADWEDVGGIFIHHLSSVESLAALRTLGMIS